MILTNKSHSLQYPAVFATHFIKPSVLLISFIIFNFTCDFLFAVVVVTGCEERAKDKSWHIDLFHLMLHNGNTLAVVPDFNHVLFSAK